MDIKVFNEPLSTNAIVPLLATSPSGCNESTNVPLYPNEIKALGLTYTDEEYSAFITNPTTSYHI
jgi:hypothetical protein